METAYQMGSMIALEKNLEASKQTENHEPYEKKIQSDRLLFENPGVQDIDLKKLSVFKMLKGSLHIEPQDS